PRFATGSALSTTTSAGRGTKRATRRARSTRSSWRSRRANETIRAHTLSRSLVTRSARRCGRLDARTRRQRRSSVASPGRPRQVSTTRTSTRSLPRTTQRSAASTRQPDRRAWRSSSSRKATNPPEPRGCASWLRRLLDQREELEHREVHRDDDGSHHGSHADHEQRLDDRRERLDARVDLVLVEVGDLAEHLVELSRLLTDLHHLAD